MIEVLKQALEALETEVSIDWTNKDEFNASAEKMHDAIASLQQAIAKLESQEPLCTAAMFDDWFLAKSGLDPKTPLYTHPPQRTVLQLKEIDRPESASVLSYNRGWNDCLFASGIVKQSQRTWVGLTDEEVKHEWVVWRANVPRYVGFAKGIEAKLKERNI